MLKVHSAVCQNQRTGKNEKVCLSKGKKSNFTLFVFNLAFAKKRRNFSTILFFLFLTLQTYCALDSVRYWDYSSSSSGSSSSSMDYECYDLNIWRNKTGTLLERYSVLISLFFYLPTEKNLTKLASKQVEELKSKDSRSDNCLLNCKL